ncbi:MAG: DNA primase [Gemmatimonadota bacterium]|nr:MAG: DNA primase [Gemmatimonadota bacterium]
MSGIPEELIERVRDTADIVEIIGEHVELKRTGSDYRGPCPFHGGKHRNFAVIPKKQMFYCFVCHEAGDVFTFFMKRLGLEYPAAVRAVAQRVGISIPDRPTGGPDPREPLFSAVAVAADWCTRRLLTADDAEAARKYLAQRGIDPERAGLLGLGYSPKGDEFLAAMDTLGVAQHVLLDAGLAVKREDETLRPRFWGRLLFPIHDIRGRIVGFGGRVLGAGEPKYLNSPESQVFHKGALLYNLHNAKQAIRREERAIVVEGYFDVLRLVEVGIEEVIAPLGTSLTEDQARLLKRYTKNVVLVYDSDSAGLRATFRAADELLRAGLRVTVATLPEGEDPDTVAVRGGAAAIQGLLDDALDVLERKLQLLDRKGWLGTLSGRRKALDRLLPTLRSASDPVTRDLYVGRTAEALGVSRESVEREAAPRGGMRVAAARADARESSYDRERPGRRRSGGGSPERELLRVMLHEPEWRSRIRESLPSDVQFLEPEGRLLGMLAAAPAEVSAAEILEGVDGAARTVLSDLIGQGLGEGNVDAIVEGALRRLEHRLLNEKKRAVARKIAVASEEEKVKLLREKAALNVESRKLRTHDWNVIRRGGRTGAG